jgi:hypothetical protein
LTGSFLGVTPLLHGFPDTQKPYPSVNAAGVEILPCVANSPALRGWPKSKHNRLLGIISPLHESHDGSEVHQPQIPNVLQSHASLFRKEFGRFNDGILMPIPFKEGVDISDLKQAPYPMSPRDKKTIDEMLDPLTAIGVVEKVTLAMPSLCPSLHSLEK